MYDDDIQQRYGKAAIYNPFDESEKGEKGKLKVTDIHNDRNAQHMHNQAYITFWFVARTCFNGDNIPFRSYRYDMRMLDEYVRAFFFMFCI